jgi:hypothetical protein
MTQTQWCSRDFDDLKVMNDISGHLELTILSLAFFATPALHQTQRGASVACSEVSTLAFRSDMYGCVFLCKLRILLAPSHLSGTTPAPTAGAV